MTQNHIFVLQQVINDLLDTDSSLEKAMVRLNYFARLIKNEELIAYTDFEINGYKNSQVPPYRLGMATLHIKMQAWETYHTAQLPVEMLEKPLNEGLKYINIFEGIKVLEVMAAKSQESQLITKKLPMTMLKYFQPAATKLYKSNVQLVVIEAWLTANSNIVIQILSTVRSRLLAFAMQIAEEFGYDIDISSFKKNQNANNKVINNFIKNEIINHGSGNITNTGNSAEVTGDIDL